MITLCKYKDLSKTKKPSQLTPEGFLKPNGLKELEGEGDFTTAPESAGLRCSKEVVERVAVSDVSGNANNAVNFYWNRQTCFEVVGAIEENQTFRGLFLVVIKVQTESNPWLQGNNIFIERDRAINPEGKKTCSCILTAFIVEIRTEFEVVGG